MAVSGGRTKRNRQGCDAGARQFTYPARTGLFFLTGFCANVILFPTSQLNDLGVLLSANCMLRGALCDADLVGQMMLARSAASSPGVKLWIW